MLVEKNGKEKTEAVPCEGENMCPAHVSQHLDHVCFLIACTKHKDWSGQFDICTKLNEIWGFEILKKKKHKIYTMVGAPA